MLESMLPVVLPLSMLAAMAVGIMIGSKGEAGVKADLEKVKIELGTLGAKLEAKIEAKVHPVSPIAVVPTDTQLIVTPKI